MSLEKKWRHPGWKKKREDTTLLLGFKNNNKFFKYKPFDDFPRIRRATNLNSYNKLQYETAHNLYMISINKWDNIR